MDTKNVIAAISLSAAVIILYSLFFQPDPSTVKKNLTEEETKVEKNTDAPTLELDENISEVSRKDALNQSKRVYFENKNENHFEPSLQLGAKVIDTSGAGDAFSGAFATFLCENKSVIESIKFANNFAGISTTRIGTANSMPNREEIDKLL